MKHLRAALLRIGLKEQEADIYLHILRKGEDAQGIISKLLKIPRATVQRRLRDLEERGFIYLTEEKKEVRALAEAPERILHHVEKELQAAEDKRRIAASMMTELRALHRADSERPSVFYIDNPHMLKTVQQNFANTEDEIIQIVRVETYRELYDNHDTAEHRRDIAEKKQKVRTIFISDGDISPSIPCEYVIIPPEAAPMQGEISVCGNRVLQFAYSGEITAVEIVSKEIADSMRVLLELAWQRAGEISEIKKQK
jgi:sugar-specific transcriptional regulator TrmB